MTLTFPGSYELAHIWYYLVMGGVIIVSGIFQFRRGRRAVELQKRCTEKVSAVCVNMERQGGYRHRRYNGTYEYEYFGQRYIANNDIWASMSLLIYISPGKVIDLFIDPYDPEKGIYDPIAANAAFNSRYISVIIIIIGIAVCLMPAVDNITGIFS